MFCTGPTEDWLCQLAGSFEGWKQNSKHGRVNKLKNSCLLVDPNSPLQSVTANNIANYQKYQTQVFT